MKSHYFFFIMLSLAFNACNGHAQSNIEYIQGKVTLHPDWKPIFYLAKPDYYKQLLAPYECKIIDSTQIEADGSFAFTNLETLVENGLYVLLVQKKGSRYANKIEERPDEENFIVLVPSPEETIRLEAEINRLQRSYQLLSANNDSKLIADLRSARSPFYREFDSLQKNATADTIFIWNTHGSHAVQDSVHARLDAFMDTCPRILPIFAALRLRAPDNEFRDRPEFFLSLQARLKKIDPAHPWVEQWSFFLDKSKLPVLKGEPMPDFSLPTPQGDTLSLDSVRATLLIVDFWASWCAPCRKEIKETLRPLYDEYGTKGLQILGISIDRDRSAWTKAIQKEGAIWPNVSDLEGDASPVRESLKFETIPANYLLDATGRLVARNLHGDQLKAFVVDYFQKNKR